jgi:ubiquinone/menaquinone biosynthesis C-methylase UbiE
MDDLYSGIMVEFYDRYAPEQQYERRATEAIAIIKYYAPEAKRVLELACGTGRFTQYLARAGFTITATDISADEITKAKSKGIPATFHVMDMSKVAGTAEYEVVGCFWESFRYLPDYPTCQRTIERIFAVLKPGGLMLVDFSHFPSTNEPIVLPLHTVDVGEGLTMTQQTIILTRGDFDTREDTVHYELHGKDVTGTTIRWKDVEVFLKPTLARSPLLRIPQARMEAMLKKAGFTVLEVRHGFSDKNSMLFVAQKK